ncbi:hypothetical protein [Brevundimonas sp.]|jgi:hypothetical protein|uniref:hypothetical protein n=1 Tax=Brevundimonas sp. TaxID=1871086 RepID=UPI002E115831|nr:hypothetical protein [Brevundimonas sp.]
MIVLLAAALACVPLAQADAFGDIRFDEGAGPGDRRLVEVRCSGDGGGECDGRDRQGVRYGFLDDALLVKTIDGIGPSAAFAARLEPASDRPETLTATVCDMVAVWVELRRGSGGRWTYGLYAQP